MTGMALKMIDIIARFGPGLPADLLPLTMHSTGRVGHDLLVIAIAQGYEQVFVLSNPNKADESSQIMHQIELARALLEGIGDDDEARFVLIDDADPDVVASRLRDTKARQQGDSGAIQPSRQPARHNKAGDARPC